MQTVPTWAKVLLLCSAPLTLPMAPLLLPVGIYFLVKHVKYAFTPYEDPFEEYLGPNPLIKGRTLADRKAGRYKPS